MPTKAKRKSTTRSRKPAVYLKNDPEFEKDMSHFMTQENRAVEEEKFFNKAFSKKRNKKHAA